MAMDKALGEAIRDAITAEARWQDISRTLGVSEAAQSESELIDRLTANRREVWRRYLDEIRAESASRKGRIGMRAEVLHIEECPSWEEASRSLRAALDSTGHRDVPITFTLLASATEAAGVPFAGSPTILIDGQDVFPSDGRTSDLACRVYLTPKGLAGQPTQEQLETTLAAHG